MFSSKNHNTLQTFSPPRPSDFHPHPAGKCYAPPMPGQGPVTKMATFGPPRAEKLNFSNKTLVSLNVIVHPNLSILLLILILERWLVKLMVKFWQTFIWTALFSFRYTNINIPNDNKWGGWWGFGTERITEISVFFLKYLLYRVWYISNAILIFQNNISGIP